MRDLCAGIRADVSNHNATDQIGPCPGCRGEMAGGLGYSLIFRCGYPVNDASDGTEADLARGLPFPAGLGTDGVGDAPHEQV